ncbi:MAG: DUF4294 domain-containing protein [Bacteroidales bacterium]
MLLLLVILLGIFNGYPPDTLDVRPGDPLQEGHTVAARVLNGDTIPVIELRPVSVTAKREFANRWEAYRYNRTVRNVKIVYPYAKLAGNMFREYSRRLMELETEKERSQFMSEAEDEIRDNFEDDLKRLTFSQGLILIKLIDRETDQTSYHILKEFRGSFSAVFWQSLGRIFGYDLREQYDPYGKDHRIEEIVQLIEEGLI